MSRDLCVYCQCGRRGWYCAECWRRQHYACANDARLVGPDTDLRLRCPSCRRYMYVGAAVSDFSCYWCRHPMIVTVGFL